jgi:HK97 family phage major capsid protein
MTQHDMTRFRGLSGVRADATDPKALIGQINTAFEEFKASHSADLKKHDVVLTEKTDRINAEIGTLGKELDKINAAMARLELGGVGDGKQDPDKRAHAQAFDKFFRRGIDAGLADLQIKAKLSTSSDPDGGYLVPETMENEITRVAGTLNAMRQVANVITIGEGDTYKLLVSQGGAGSGWVGEQEGRSETATATLKEISLTMGEIYANAPTTQKMLDDGRIDVAAWLADEVSMTFEEQEGAAFATGDGVNKPRGILSYTNIANASYAWGSVGYIATGASGAFATATTAVSPADALIDVYFSLKSKYRNGATWMMSDATMGTVRKIKDVDGKFVWNPPTAVGEVPSILQKPVVTDDNMTAIGANSYSIAFADFRRAYQIVDKFGVRVLRDPYTSKPNVLFYVTKRVGGGIRNFEAIKLLKFGSS